MAQTTAPKTALDNKPIIAVLDGFANAFNAHDLDRILSFMTDDCVFQASAGPDVDGEKFAGKEAVRKAFKMSSKPIPMQNGRMPGILFLAKEQFQNGHLQEQSRTEPK